MQGKHSLQLIGYTSSGRQVWDTLIKDAELDEVAAWLRRNGFSEIDTKHDPLSLPIYRWLNNQNPRLMISGLGQNGSRTATHRAVSYILAFVTPAIELGQISILE